MNISVVSVQINLGLGPYLLRARGDAPLPRPMRRPCTDTHTIDTSTQSKGDISAMHARTTLDGWRWSETHRRDCGFPSA
jgi:hypothetical protein